MPDSPLPPGADAARLAAVPPAQARRLRQTLAAAGFPLPPGAPVSAAFERRARGGGNLPRRLHITSAETPLHSVLRLFSLGVPVSRRAAAAALAPVPLEEWEEAGLVRPIGDAVEGAVAIDAYEDLLFVSDPPRGLDAGAASDHVAGPTMSTAALAAFMARGPWRNALDLGSGTGILAFLAARSAAHVLATDLNPRAVDMARFNARLNGIANVEFAAGPGFEPARGRRFDFIIANPPCNIGPWARYTFADSGMELDALCRQFVAEADQYLDPGGLFQCSAQWPNIGDDDWTRRIASWTAGPSCDRLAFLLDTSDALTHSEEVIQDTSPAGAAERLRQFEAYADYFHQRGVTSLSYGLLALRKRAAAGEGWLRTIELDSRRASPFGDAVTGYFAAADLLDSLGPRLLDVKLCPAPKLSVLVNQSWTGAAWQVGGYVLREGAGFEMSQPVDGLVANLVRRCDGEPTLREAIRRVSAESGVAAAPLEAKLEPVARDLVQRGFLIVVEPG